MAKNKLRIALVHDYIKEFGGAERVLKTLTEMFPGTPIYTAFRVKGSTADKEFSGVKVIESPLAPILKIGNLYSPLRFLIPVIWGSFDLSDYDLVIVSSSWYVTRGFKVGRNTKVIDYCHTPPRWLYGYETSVGFTKYWPVKIYAAIVGHFIRMFDFNTAQKVDRFVANSKEVAGRIEKYYRRDSVVIYPPVDTKKIGEITKGIEKGNFYLIASRLTGAKGIETVVNFFESKPNLELKIVGEASGYSKLGGKSAKNIEFLGRLSDEELYKTYAKAKAMIALAKNEDFGMTVVEAQAAGTPVVAYRGGGFKETVIDGKTGVFVDSTDSKAIAKAIGEIEKTNWDRNKIQQNASKFSKEKFVKEMLQFVNVQTKK